MFGQNPFYFSGKKVVRLVAVIFILLNVLGYFYYAEVVENGVLRFVAYSTAMQVMSGDGLSTRYTEDLPECRLNSSNLRRDVSPAQRLEEEERDPSVLTQVQPGGVYSPPDCQSSSKVAIIVPFRDRAEHRVIFLRHMHSFLQKQKVSYRIFFIELTYKSQFNRALLMNAGFVYASNITSFSCYIYHDVDLLPTNEFNIYNCSDVMHFASNNSKYGYRLLYSTYFGGVVGFSEKAFRSINGCSNLYYGWGNEDDDLYKRVRQKIPELFQRQSLSLGVYKALEHAQEEMDTKKLLDRKQLDSTSTVRTDKDGLSTLNVTYVAVENRDLYTWVLVEVDEEYEIEKYKTCVATKTC